MRPSLAPLFLLVAAVAMASIGCGHHVGDTCNTNVDCSPLGDRFCDVAAPSGYCTIEGCDVRSDSAGNLIDSCSSAASESVCVRFFSLEACKPCDPSNAAAYCASDELCLCDRTDPTRPGGCLPPTMSSGGQCTDPRVTLDPSLLGHCARLSSERRWCMLKCSNNGDCRGGTSGYVCIAAGTNGAEPVPRQLEPIGGVAGAGLIGVGDYTQKFCVFQGP